MGKESKTLEWPYPPEIAQRIDNCLSFGNTGIIEIISPGDRVRKSPHPQSRGRDKQWQISQLGREVEVYRRLPRHHGRLLRFFDFHIGEDEAYITLEYMQRGSVSAYLASGQPVSQTQRLTWCLEAAEAVALLHSHNIVHADIKPANMVLDEHLGLRLIDMAGCAIDDREPLCLESTRYFLPRNWKGRGLCSIKTDLFALGSSLYEFMTGVAPYNDLSDPDVEERFGRDEFPPVDGMACGSIVQACWMRQFESAEDVVIAIRGLAGSPWIGSIPKVEKSDISDTKQ